MRVKITKNKRGHSPSIPCDVRLSIHNGGSGNSSAFVATFYNGSHKMVSTTEYIIPSLDVEVNRLYFETGNSANGFKISAGSTKQAAPKIRFAIKNVDEWKGRVGTFNLSFDTNERLYYVDLNNKI